MRHLSLTLIAAALLALFLAGIEGRALANEGDDLLVRPPALEKNVQFWIRVFQVHRHRQHVFLYRFDTGNQFRTSGGAD